MRKCKKGESVSLKSLYILVNIKQFALNEKMNKNLPFFVDELYTLDKICSQIDGLFCAQIIDQSIHIPDSKLDDLPEIKKALH